MRQDEAGRLATLLTYAEAAASLHISKRTLQRWIDAGRLPVVALTQHSKRISAADLRELIHQSTSR